MRRHLVAAGTLTLLLASGTGVAAADDGYGSDRARGPVVVAKGLDNPRQLNWLGDRLLVAEGGRGGSRCVAPGICVGRTGQVSAIDNPFRNSPGGARTLVDRLFSVLIRGTGAIGSDGVAWTGFPGVFLIAEGEPTPDALVPPGFETVNPRAETQEHLLISVDGHVFPWVDFGALEKQKNPDRKPELDSNPNAVIVVDPTPRSGPGHDEYALVADAGANTVWKVDPDFGHRDKNGLPKPHVTVFTAFDASNPKAPEFVPSSLDQDDHGNIYVGGVGSLTPGAAAVVRYDARGHRTGRWGGFTAINGLAVSDDGRHVYVSQITVGDVVRLDTRARTWTSFDVPSPSGLALGEDARRGSDAVFVSANSQSTARQGGQVWRFSFPEKVKEKPLPVPLPPPGPPAP